MFTRLGRFLLAKKMGKLVRLATEALYSEQFDLEKCITKLSKGNEGIHLLRAYVAVQTAATLTEPIKKDDILRVLDQSLSSEGEVVDPEFEEIVGLHRDLAEIYWLQRTKAILEGKLACQVDEYSYEGLVYRIENAKKGPASNEERAQFRKLAEELCIAEKGLEDHLDEKASQEAAEAAFERIKEEVERERRARGGGGPTQEELEAEYQDLIGKFAKISKGKREEA